MATYIMAWVVKADDDEDANAVMSEADDLIGSFTEGSIPNGYTGFKAFGGNVVKVLDSNLSMP
jgi:hypothetical protein